MAGASLPRPVSSAIYQARWATSVIFAVNGAALATWVSRIPAIKDGLVLNDAQLGVALFGIAVGALASFPLAGYLVPRWGSRAVTVAAGLFLCAALIVLALVSSLAGLALALVGLGAGSGAMDVAMNAQGVEVEQRLGRPIMGSLHAMFSVGGLCGASLGGLLVEHGLAPLSHFLLFSALGVLLIALSATRLLRPERAASDVAAPSVFALPDRKLLVFGVLAFCAFLTEGAVADWSAVFLRDTLKTSAAFAAVGFAVFSLAMTIMRFGADALVARLGAARLVAGGGLLSAVGLGAALIVATPWAALLGFACIGVGMASVAPLVFSAAGRASGVSSGAGIAAVATMGYAGFLAGPASIGFLAHSTSLRLALGILIVPGLIIAVLGSRVNAVNTGD